jgi:hypothetical protein
MAEEVEGFVSPMLRFGTAPLSSGFSRIAGQKHLRFMDALSDLVEEGKRQGTIRKGIDSRLAAWEIIVVAWGENLAQAAGMDEFIAEGFSARIWDLFFSDMANREPRSTTGDEQREPTGPGRFETECGGVRSE